VYSTNDGKGKICFVEIQLRQDRRGEASCCCDVIGWVGAWECRGASVGDSHYAEDG
jgi:hypothetical protein